MKITNWAIEAVLAISKVFLWSVMNICNQCGLVSYGRLYSFETKIKLMGGGGGGGGVES